MVQMKKTIAKIQSNLYQVFFFSLSLSRRVYTPFFFSLSLLEFIRLDIIFFESSRLELLPTTIDNNNDDDERDTWSSEFR